MKCIVVVVSAKMHEFGFQTIFTSISSFGAALETVRAFQKGTILDKIQAKREVES